MAGILSRVAPECRAGGLLGRAGRFPYFRCGRPSTTSWARDDLPSQIIVFGFTLWADVLQPTVHCVHAFGFLIWPLQLTTWSQGSFTSHRIATVTACKGALATHSRVAAVHPLECLRSRTSCRNIPDPCQSLCRPVVRSSCRSAPTLRDRCPVRLADQIVLVSSDLEPWESFSVHCLNGMTLSA